MILNLEFWIYLEFACPEYSRGVIWNFVISAKSSTLRPGHLADMRLGLGLRRSLICFAPLAFVSQCQKRPRKVPSPSVFLTISTHFTASPSVPLSSTSLKSAHLVPGSEVKPRDFRYDAANHLHDTLRPVNPDNACILRITATAGYTSWTNNSQQSTYDKKLISKRLLT